MLTPFYAVSCFSPSFSSESTSPSLSINVPESLSQSLPLGMIQNTEQKQTRSATKLGDRDPHKSQIRSGWGQTISSYWTHMMSASLQDETEGRKRGPSETPKPTDIHREARQADLRTAAGTRKESAGSNSSECRRPT